MGLNQEDPDLTRVHWPPLSRCRRQGLEQEAREEATGVIEAGPGH